MNACEREVRWAKKNFPSQDTHVSETSLWLFLECPKTTGEHKDQITCLNNMKCSRFVRVIFQGFNSICACHLISTDTMNILQSNEMTAQEKQHH